jgi:flagellar hook-basal body complex protein FliE
MTLPAINPLSISPSLSAANAASSGNTASSSGNFAQTLANAVDQTNNALQTADNMASSYAAGGPVSLDQLMVAEQQASLSLDLVVQVRDRAVSAYQSIMNMQI